MDIVKRVYDKIAGIYDDFGQEPINKLEDLYVYKLLTRFIDLRKSTIDLGCGTAPVLDYLTTTFKKIKYTGIDLSTNMIKVAQFKHPDFPFVVSNMQNLPFFANSFHNVISLFGSMSYSTNILASISEINRILKPGGRFFIMLYGLKYKSRDRYILNTLNMPSSAKEYSSQDAKILFRDFDKVRISGMTFLSNKISSHLSPELAFKYHKFEAEYLSKYFPDKFYFHIITGEKHAKNISKEIH